MRFNRRKFEMALTPLDPITEAKRKAQSLADSGRVEEAVELLSTRLEQTPSRTDILLVLAKILLKAGRLEEAIDVLIVLDAHLPNNGEVSKMLGTVYGQTRQYGRALEALTKASRQLPTDPEVLIAMARADEQLGHQEAAIRHIRRAVRLKPKDSSLRCTAASLLHHNGFADEARSMLKEDQEIFQLPHVRLLESMMFPVVPDSTEEIATLRSHYFNVLRELMEGGDVIDNPEKSILQTDFLLGYHGLADRELIQLHAEVLLKISPSLGYVSPNLVRLPTAGRKLRVGFVSSNMRNHSVGRVLNRFLKELDRSKFEVTLFELPGKFEGGQELGRSAADKTVFLSGDLARERTAIEAEEPDILVFPDFVLDPVNDCLAFSRLAPVQCSTWGHPGTSGRPSLDYWISCGDWDPPGNERFYTEKLVRLSRPPMIATRLDLPDPVADRRELGLPKGILYGCPQSIYKLHPEFDPILAKILTMDPDSHVVLIGGVQPFWVERFKQRFRRSFADVENRLVILPHLDTRQYLSLLSHCSVSLDPIHFGGANTSMEAFSMGLPVVTWPGDQLRNRQTFSFYRMMDFMELVADSEESYVRLALRVAHDESYKARVSEIVRERCSLIFDTVNVTRELEEFFVAATERAAGARNC